MSKTKFSIQATTKIIFSSDRCSLIKWYHPSFCLCPKPWESFMISLIFTHRQSNSSSPLVLVLKRFLKPDYISSTATTLVMLYLPAPCPQYFPSQQPEESQKYRFNHISFLLNMVCQEGVFGCHKCNFLCTLLGEKSLAILEFPEIHTYVLYPLKK